MKFYSQVQRRASALASGAENIEMGLRGTAGIDVNTRESVALNWRKYITKLDEVEEEKGSESATSAKYMLYRAIYISEMPELHKIRLQQVITESYKFYPMLKSIVQRD